MSKVILTGSSGFIGQHLNSHLKDNGYNVYSISRNELSDSKMPIKGFFGSQYHADADVVIHLVGAAHRKFTDDESSFINFKLTKKVLDRTVELGIPRFILLSSVNVYAECDEVISLDTVINSSKLPNIMQSKLIAEEYVKKVAFEHAVETIIIRSPLVYGEGVKANFASLMNLVSKGIPLPFGCITNNKRSLVSVDNLVDLIITCIDHPKAANQVFLVSDDHYVSTSEMVKEMAIALGKPSWQIPLPAYCYKLVGKLFDKNDVVDRLTGSLQVDISHTKETLGWTPPQTLQEGFKKTAEAFLKSKQSSGK
ncbi:TPA: NAD-dependent epimerase/dehydratase family protein [Vibrio vulnificus]